MVGNKKKVLINDFDPAKDHIPNKEFQALSPGSRKKWNEHRAAAHTIGATRTVSNLNDKDGAASFDPELHQWAKEHTHREITKSCTKSADADSKGDVTKEEPTPKKKYAGWQFGHSGCQTED